MIRTIIIGIFNGIAVVLIAPNLSPLQVFGITFVVLGIDGIGRAFE